MDQKIIILFQQKTPQFTADEFDKIGQIIADAGFSHSVKPFRSDDEKLLEKYPDKLHMVFILKDVIGNPTEKDIEESITSYIKSNDNYINLKVIKA